MPYTPGVRGIKLINWHGFMAIYKVWHQHPTAQLFGTPAREIRLIRSQIIPLREPRLRSGTRRIFPLCFELLSNLVFELFQSCGGLIVCGGFYSVCEPDACDDLGQIIEAA